MFHFCHTTLLNPHEDRAPVGCIFWAIAETVHLWRLAFDIHTDPDVGLCNFVFNNFNCFCMLSILPMAFPST